MSTDAPRTDEAAVAVGRMEATCALTAAAAAESATVTEKTRRTLPALIVSETSTTATPSKSAMRATSDDCAAAS